LLVNSFTSRTVGLYTKLNDLLSDVKNLFAGVIQGSVIGPLMFLVYINDLVAVLAHYDVTVKLFAVVVKLYVKIVNKISHDVFQSAFNALCAWAIDWQLSVSVDKCCILHIGTVNEIDKAV